MNTKNTDANPHERDGGAMLTTTSLGKTNQRRGRRPDPRKAQRERASEVTNILFEADGSEDEERAIESLAAELEELPAAQLNKKARTIWNKLTRIQWKGIMKARAASSYVDAAERLNKVKRAEVDDKVIIAVLMAMVKGRCSERDFAQMFEVISEYYGAYPRPWLKGAREACEFALERKKRNQTKGNRDKNRVNEDDFEDVVVYALDELAKANSGKAVNCQPTMFRYGTEIACIDVVEEAGLVRVSIIGQGDFAARMPGKFYKSHGDAGTQGVSPPSDLVNKLYRMPSADLPLPYLRGVIQVPTFAEDASLNTRPGYDSRSMTYYAPPEGLEVSRVGSWSSADARQRDLAEAKRLLVEELLADFAFDGWNRESIMRSFNGDSKEPLPASLLNTIGLLLEQFCRPMIAGPTPGVLVSKPKPGTGATLLMTTVQIIVSGRSNARPPLAESEEERRKALFTAVKGGEPVILYDNVTGIIDSPTLAALLTSTTFTDRTLGRSEERMIPVLSTLVFTANNVLFSDELQRRLSMIRLDARVHDPKARSGWRHEDIEGWCEAHRGKLIWACLTLIQNWIDKGCNGPKHMAPVASYPGWCYVIGGILEAADAAWTTFQGNRREIASFAAADEEDGLLHLLRALHDYSQTEAKEASKLLSSGLTAKRVGEIAVAEGVELPVKYEGHSEDRTYIARALSPFLASSNGAMHKLETESGPVTVELRKAGKEDNTQLWRLVVGEVVEQVQPKAAARVARVSASYRNFPISPKSYTCVLLDEARRASLQDPSIKNPFAR